MEKRLKIKAGLMNLTGINSFITESMKESGLSEREVFNVQNVVDEACTNIITHGYAGEEGLIEIVCRMTDEEVKVVIKDQGKPFNPLSAPPPDLNAELESRKIGGLGVHFIKTLMDEVGYEFMDGVNTLTLTKFVRKKNG